jgi:hypothetical protein
MLAEEAPMSRESDPVRKKFGPLLEKTLQNALAHCIAEQFPRVGGPRIQQLCAEMILQVIDDHVRSREHVRHGQVLWLAVAIHDPPSRRKRIADTCLVPVVLDVSTAEDVQSRLERQPSERRLQRKLVRLCQQAYQQGGLLSNCDLAELLNRDDGTVAALLTAHERQTGQLVPRRATLHDVGTGLTHKAIICSKRYQEGKSSDQIARETYHSMEAVDRYLGQFDRVRHCRQQGLTPEQTAFTLNCGLSLVREYLALDRELEVPA